MWPFVVPLMWFRRPFVLLCPPHSSNILTNLPPFLKLQSLLEKSHIVTGEQHLGDCHIPKASISILLFPRLLGLWNIFSTFLDNVLSIHILHANVSGMHSFKLLVVAMVYCIIVAMQPTYLHKIFYSLLKVKYFIYFFRLQKFNYGCYHCRMGLNNSSRWNSIKIMNSVINQ